MLVDQLLQADQWEEFLWETLAEDLLRFLGIPKLGGLALRADEGTVAVTIVKS